MDMSIIHSLNAGQMADLADRLPQMMMDKLREELQSLIRHPVKLTWVAHSDRDANNFIVRVYDCTFERLDSTAHVSFYDESDPADSGELDVELDDLSEEDFDKLLDVFGNEDVMRKTLGHVFAVMHILARNHCESRINAIIRPLSDTTTAH